MLLLRATFLLTALSAFAADWNKPAFPEWSEKTLLRVVTDSPWARAASVNLIWHKRDEQPLSPRDIPGADPNAQKVGGNPIGGIGVPRRTLPDKADLLVRWSSALPVRQAKALYKQRAGKLGPARLYELVGPAEPDYVVEIYGVPAEVAHSGAAGIEALAKQSATLRTGTGRKLRAARARVELTGATLTIFVHFPRNEPITAAERDVEFRADFTIFEVRERFRLNAMQYQGRLEL
jgi:hypothetical protein